MSHDSEFATALNALSASPKRPTAAEVVRKNLDRLRQRKRDGVDELKLLDLVNSQARSPITLYTLRCYLSRGVGRTGNDFELPRAPVPGKRATPKAAPSTRPRADSRAQSQISVIAPARTEQRGVIQPVKPGPVE